MFYIVIVWMLYRVGNWEVVMVIKVNGLVDVFMWLVFGVVVGIIIVLLGRIRGF